MMGTKRTEKACATRKQLLEAALAVIGGEGVLGGHGRRDSRCGRRIEGRGVLSLQSKAVMAESILEEGIGGLIEGFERIAAEAPTAPEALTGMVELFATSIFENKAFGRFFVSELWREGRVWSRSMRDYEGRLLDVLEGQLARGQREGFIRSEIDPAFEAVALIGMVLTTTLYYIGDESPLLGAPSHQRAGAQAIGGKNGFIARIVDFVRHANASPGVLG